MNLMSELEDGGGLWKFQRTGRIVLRLTAVKDAEVEIDRLEFPSIQDAKPPDSCAVQIAPQTEGVAEFCYPYSWDRRKANLGVAT
jgi:hypothetical protein